MKFAFWTKKSITYTFAFLIILTSINTKAQFTDGSLVKGGNDNIFLIVRGKACWVSDAKIFNILGLDWKNVKPITEKQLNSIPKGWLIVKASGKPVYVIVFGVACRVTDASTLSLLGFDSNLIRPISDDQLKKIPQEPMLIKGNGSPVYIVNNGKAVWIPSEKIFNALGFEMKRVMKVKDDIISKISTSTFLIKGQDQKIYLVDKDKRYWISNADLFNRLGYDWNAVITLRQSQIDNIPEGEPIR